MSQDSTTPASEAALSELRSQIDTLDDRLVALIKERTSIVEKVGALKAATAPGVCPLRPGREADQLRHIVKAFEGSNFHPIAAASIWRGIINASLAVEGDVRVAVYATDEYPDLYWLAREYFGSFASIVREPGVKRVIGDIMDEKVSIGVVPALRTDEVSPWWPDLAQTSAEEGPKIFARIPFVDSQRPARDQQIGIAIGAVKPEETGEDVSFFALEAEENTSMHRLQAAFSTARLQAVWVDVLTHASGRRYHLVELKGFITPSHAGFSEFAAILGTALLNTVFLGAYAVPITIGAIPKNETLRHDIRPATA